MAPLPKPSQTWSWGATARADGRHCGQNGVLHVDPSKRVTPLYEIIQGCPGSLPPIAAIASMVAPELVAPNSVHEWPSQRAGSAQKEQARPPAHRSSGPLAQIPIGVGALRATVHS